MSNVLITAGSGNIGTHLIPLLLQRPSVKTLVLPTTNAPKLSSQIPPISSPSSVIVEEGNVQDPQWVEYLLTAHSINTLFLNLTGLDQFFTTLNFFSAMKRAGCVKHLVYLSAATDLTTPSVVRELLRDHCTAHGVVKVVVEQVLHASRTRAEGGWSWTVIGPAMFMENDRRAKTSMLSAAGLYPEPVGHIGGSRTAVKDIALGVANAIEDQGRRWDRKKVMIGSLKSYNSDDLSKIWGEALGKPIKVASIDDKSLDDLENQIRSLRGPVWARDMRLRCEWFRDRGFGLTEEQFNDGKALLGKEPSSYGDFVKEEARQWKDEAQAQ